MRVYERRKKIEKRNRLTEIQKKENFKIEIEEEKEKRRYK